MKFREEKHRQWSFDRSFKGRKNGVIVTVHWNDYHKYWYFSAVLPNGKSYNSLWDELSYQSQGECEDAAEKHCDSMQ